MVRALLVASVCTLLAAPPAAAVLVYQRPSSKQIVAARNDGSAPRVIAHGRTPVVAPNGEDVGFIKLVPGEEIVLRLVDIEGEHRRLVAHQVYAPLPWAPFAWSPNSRRIAVGLSSLQALLVDIGSGQRRKTETNLGKSSFSPDSRGALLEDVSPGQEDMYFASFAHGIERVLHGALPTWGSKGIAFSTDAGVWFKRDLNAQRRSLRKRKTPILYTVDWSADGNTLLLAEGQQDRLDLPGVLHPVLINRETATARKLPQQLSFIEAISKDGKAVLGEQNGNVVVARADGSLRVLATGATTPSWTK